MLSLSSRTAEKLAIYPIEMQWVLQTITANCKCKPGKKKSILNAKTCDLVRVTTQPWGRLLAFMTECACIDTIQYRQWDEPYMSDWAALPDVLQLWKIVFVEYSSILRIRKHARMLKTQCTRTHLYWCDVMWVNTQGCTGKGCRNHAVLSMQ